MYFICFFITILTARIALEYYSDIPLLSAVIKWLMPTANWLCYIAAGIAAVVFLIKTIKMIFTNSSGILECIIVFSYSLGATITVGWLAPSYAIMQKNLLYYVIPTVCVGATFLLAIIITILKKIKKKKEGRKV